MKLIHREIPSQFRQDMPAGLKLVHKDNQEFILVEKLCCPRGHSLMVDTVRIHSEPSIHIHAAVGHSEGEIYVDAFWGGHAKLYNFIPDVSGKNPLVKASCPVCGTSLLTKSACSFKGCPAHQTILFHLPGAGNRIYVCARLGCPGHRIELAGLPHRISDNLSEINYIGNRAESILLEI